jgi:hypothetical protein
VIRYAREAPGTFDVPRRVEELEPRFPYCYGSVRELRWRLLRDGWHWVATRAIVVTVVAIERAMTEEALREGEARYRALFETLQEELVHPLPDVVGLELAMRSLPAPSPALVGGNFSDVFPLPVPRGRSATS